MIPSARQVGRPGVPPRHRERDIRDLIAEERFQAAQQARAIDQLANAVLSLPMLPTDGLCCEDQDLRVITADLEQSCQLEYDQAGWIASTGCGHHLLREHARG